MNSNDLTYNELPSNPRTPPTNKRRLFPKSDGWYDKNSSGTVSKLATTDDISSPSYLVYTAIVTNSGVGPPVATVLENTLGGTPTWSRQAQGTFRATLTDAFTANKSIAFVSNDYVNGSSEHSTGSFVSNDYYEMYAYTITNTTTDEVVLFVEFRVYN